MGRNVNDTIKQTEIEEDIEAVGALEEITEVDIRSLTKVAISGKIAQEMMKDENTCMEIRLKTQVWAQKLQETIKTLITKSI